MRGKPGRPKAGSTVLSRERIFATALRLVDAHGTESLSMRRLASELAVDPMAIYHHVPGKRALLAGLVELVFGELQLPSAADTPWQDQVRAFARAYREVVRAHPNLALHLISSLESGSPALLAANEALYSALAAAGLAPSAIAQAADLVVDYLNGWALGQTQAPAVDKGTDEGPGLAALLRRYPAAHVPTLRRVLEAPREQGAASVDGGLEIIIAGISALVGRSDRLNT